MLRWRIVVWPKPYDPKGETDNLTSEVSQCSKFGNHQAKGHETSSLTLTFNQVNWISIEVIYSLKTFTSISTLAFSTLNVYMIPPLVIDCCQEYLFNSTLDITNLLTLLTFHATVFMYSFSIIVPKIGKNDLIYHLF